MGMNQPDPSQVWKKRNFNQKILRKEAHGWEVSAETVD